MDVSDLLRASEGKCIEFKRDLSSLQPILKTVVAFANTAGGTIVIGREDDGVVRGVSDPISDEERIASTIAENIRPLLLPEIEFVSSEGKTLILIRVARSLGPFYLKKRGPDAGVYVRLESTNRLAPPELREELLRQRQHTTYDLQPCPGTTFEDLDKKLLKKLGKQLKYALTKSKLRTLNLLLNDSGREVLSNAGAILLAKQEVRQIHFPNIRILCARFKGRDKSVFLDRYECTGSLFESIQEIIRFIQRNTRLSADISGTHRKDIPEYSAVALREAIVNALVHSDYSIRDGSTFISIYDNRLEIRNPGMLPFGMTIEDIQAGISRIRNHGIARLFSELGLVEGWGSGYQRILAVCHESGYPVPEWREVGFNTEVVFRPHPLTQGEEVTTAGIVSVDESGLSDCERAILTVVRGASRVTFKEIYDELDLQPQPSERTIRNRLTSLRDQGLIVSKGRGRGAYWTTP